jgi:ribose 5-phosphate isomerase B
MQLVQYLSREGYEVEDLGAFSAESTDYPEYGHAIANCVAEGKAEFGISLCGSGNGINMTANKHPEIRSALCWTAEIAELARRHNNANICALPARFITLEEAKLIAHTFLTAPFDGGRHQRRIDKIPL